MKTYTLGKTIWKSTGAGNLFNTPLDSGFDLTVDESFLLQMGAVLIKPISISLPVPQLFVFKQGNDWVEEITNAINLLMEKS